MATSSIFSNIKITDPKEAEAFIEALEASENERENKPSAPDIPVLSNIDEIKKLMAKRFPSQ